jgi:hypothetical protein
MDTVGICDTEIKDQSKIINLIKGRVSSNFRHIDLVFIVFRAERIISEYLTSIKTVFKWLHYRNNWSRFRFVSTFADGLKSEQKDKMREEAKEVLGLKNTEIQFVGSNDVLQTVIYTGFLRENALNELTREWVQESWRDLDLLLSNPGNSPRIEIS